MSDDKEITEMPAEVDFSESIPNPYAGRVRTRVTVNVDSGNVAYFKAKAAYIGVPYRIIINL